MLRTDECDRGNPGRGPEGVALCSLWRVAEIVEADQSSGFGVRRLLGWLSGFGAGDKFIFQMS